MMTTKSKSTIIILTTLLLGMAVGLLLGGAIRHRKKADFDRMPRGERFHHSMERIIRPTKKQKEAMDAILKTRYGQIDELREKFEEEIFTVYDSLKNDLDALLTDEQRGRLATRLASGPEKIFENRLNRLTDELELTDEQISKIKELASKHFLPMSSPTDGRLRPKDREHRFSLRKRMEQFHEEIQSILTPEQLEKFEKSKRRDFGRFGRRRHDFPPPHEKEMRPPPPLEWDIEDR